MPKANKIVRRECPLCGMETHKSDFAWRDGDIDICPTHNIVPAEEVTYWKEGSDPGLDNDGQDLLNSSPMPKIYERENVRLATENRRLRAKLDAARDCLNFYAHERNYFDGRPTLVVSTAGQVTERDNGTQARETLQHVFGEEA